MCGISGIVSLNNTKINYNELITMTAVMQKRGPDASGLLITNNEDLNGPGILHLSHSQNIGLGHRRLAVNDLSDTANQPMCDVTGRYWIVFNGQLYNHAELRQKLEKRGYSFKTDHSDTEVILNAYSCWGIDCLAQFNGTWSFCLWDTLSNSLFMARDRAGTRPFYYTLHNKNFYFASELNAILENKSIGTELDEFAVYDYLTYTNVPAPRTIIKGIQKLPAAHYLFFKPGGEIVARQYWSPVRNDRPLLNLSEEEIAGQIRERLFKAVESRMQADVKVGVLLSGGLDSSISLACMSRLSPGPVKAYTVGFENKDQYRNEFDHARKVAALFKAEHRELIVTEKDFFDFLPRLAYLQDEPIADPAITPIHFISQLAAGDGVKVLLGGEGSDELFVGYQHWRLIYEFEKFFRNKPLLARGIAYLHRNSMFRERRPHYQTWTYKLKNNWPVFWSGTELRTEADKRGILSPDFLNRIGAYTSFDPMRELYSSLTERKPYATFDWMAAADLQHRLPDQLLARLDRMMMASSIEGRHPFLDVNLIELAAGIPPEMKVKNKTEKYLLKKAFENVLPKEIIYRAKDSFSVPMADLFSNQKRKKIYLDLIDSFNKKTGIFLKDYIRQLESPAKLKEFWNVLNLALWHENHCQSAPVHLGVPASDSLTPVRQLS